VGKCFAFSRLLVVPNSGTNVLLIMRAVVRQIDRQH
jgi:hypothetical protein